MQGVREWVREHYEWAHWYVFTYLVATTTLLEAQGTGLLDAQTAVVCYAAILVMVVGIAGISYFDRWWCWLEGPR